MGYLVQMAGLAVQNFLSAATGIVVAIALIRGFARHTAQAIGNFWVDVTRSTLYVLLPLSIVLALVLASQGVIQNFAGYKDATTVETITYETSEAGCRWQCGQGRCRQCRDRKRHDPDADAADGAGGLPGIHQGTGHQRWRVLQRQLFPSLRESDAADQPAGNRRDPAHPVRPHLYLRQDGRRYAAGLGLAGRHADTAGKPDPGGLLQRAARQPAGRGPGNRPGRQWHAARRQHGGQGDPLRHCGLGRIRGGHDGDFLRRRQHDA